MPDPEHAKQEPDVCPTPRMGDAGVEGSWPLGGLAVDPHPCMATAVQPRGSPQEKDHFQWLLQQLRVSLRQQLDGQRAELEAALLREHAARPAPVAELAEPEDPAFARLEGLLRGQHQELVQRLEASSLQLQSTENRLAESLDRFVQQQVQQQHTMRALRGLSGTLASGTSSTQLGESNEDLVAKLRAGNEERLQAMDQKLEDVQKLLQTHPRLQTASKASTADGGGPDTLHESEGANPSGRPMPHPEEAAFWPDGAELESGSSPTRGRRSSRWSGGAITAAFRSVFARPGLRPKGSEVLSLEVASAFVILATLVWRGVEADMAFNAAASHTDLPGYTQVVEMIIAVVFALEVGARMALQGGFFFLSPDAPLNLLDCAVVFLQAVDAIWYTVNMSWLRSLRLLRLLCAARVLRSARCVRELRLFVVALWGSAAYALWVLAALLASSYLFSVFLLHSIRALTEGNTSPLDPRLVQHYGSVGRSMLTLFKAVSGGAPWEKLLQPLEDVSAALAAAFVAYLALVLYALLNVATGLFVGKVATQARRDADARLKLLVSTSGSPIRRLRDLLDSPAVFGAGKVSEAELGRQLQDPEFLQCLRGVGMEPWEARGLFELLDADSLGMVSTDHFFHCIVSMKAKECPLDLAAILHENKRIINRMHVFMRFSEDHFKKLRESLGMSGRSRGLPPLDDYLQTTIDPSRRMSAGLSGIVGISRGL